MSMTSRNWAMLIHLSSLATIPMSALGILVPILIWQLKKDEFPELDPHGKMVVNFVITVIMLQALGFLTTCMGIGLLVLVGAYIIQIVFAIIGGIKANDGELWEYPLTLKLIK